MYLPLSQKCNLTYKRYPYFLASNPLVINSGCGYIKGLIFIFLHYSASRTQNTPPMALIVHKYGGTSMGSTERIKNVAKRVAKWR